LRYRWSSLLPTGSIRLGVLWAALFFAAFAGACAGTPEGRTLVVLLAEDDGRTGKVSVATSAGTQLLDEAGEATAVSSPQEAPSAPSVMAPDEVAEIFGAALEAQPERPAVFVLYFKPDSDALTDESMSLVPGILDAIDLRRSVDTSVVGHTDTIGAREYNYELSRKRAQKIRDLLVSRGVAPAILDVTSHGEENLLVSTGDETAEPRNRRVEVTVR
jgi:outer membrane protein OmpA-like peptidoglycan-associated protein